MSTGYTHRVESGEITTLREFALRCSCAFLGEMRAVNREKPARFATPDPYYENSVREAEHRLRRVETMTDEECAAKARVDYDAEIERNREYVQRHEIESARFEAMIEKVTAWSPPQEFESLKEFMLEQLIESVKWTKSLLSDSRRAPILRSVEEWRKAELEDARQSLEDAREYHENEVKGVAKRNEWVGLLFDSLPKE